MWRAYDLRDHAFVAVKVLQRLEAAHLVRFVHEQAVRIEHRHVAAPTSWAGDDERVAFAMPLARGGSLAGLLARHGPLPPGYVVELLHQLLDGLAAVHAAGIVHRDLKPANLLLEATGRRRPHLRIGDFGVAAPAGTPSPAGIGTPGYAPPEQLAGAPPDPRQDLYAVGAVARRLLGPGPGPLDAWIDRLTAVEPHHRPATATEARHLLGTCGRLPRGPRPDVRDRLGVVAVPLPGAHRRTARTPAPDRVLLAACFVVAALVGALATLRLCA